MVEQYLMINFQVCTPMRLDKSNTYYIVGFEPLAEKYTAHHMLLYGTLKELHFMYTPVKHEIQSQP